MILRLETCERTAIITTKIVKPSNNAFRIFFQVLNKFQLYDKLCQFHICYIVDDFGIKKNGLFTVTPINLFFIIIKINFK